MEGTERCSVSKANKDKENTIKRKKKLLVLELGLVTWEHLCWMDAGKE